MPHSMKPIAPAPLGPLLRAAEAARILGLAPRTLRAWRASDPSRLPFVKVGSCVRYRPADVDAYVEANRHAEETPS